MARYRQIIWDWNGTLLDDAWLSVATVNHILGEEGLPTIDEERYARIFGFPLRPYYEELGFDIDRIGWDELCRRFYAYYQAREHECSLAAGAVEVLDELKRREFGQSILSAYEPEGLARLVSHHELEDFFGDVQGVEDPSDGKVAVGKRWFAATGIDPSEVVYVGDTDHDHEVADALGVDCVLVESGHQHRDRLEARGARVLRDLAELLDLVG